MTIGRSSAFLAAMALATAAVPAAHGALVLRYSFDEASGDARDSSGFASAADGAFIGATRTNNTPFGGPGGALDLTGSVDSPAGTTPDWGINGNTAVKLDALPALTLTAWIKMPVGGTVKANDRIMSRITTANGFDFRLASGAAALMQIEFSVDNTTKSVASGATINIDNRWAFIAVTYVGSATTSTRTYFSGTEAVDVPVAQLGTASSANYTEGLMNSNLSAKFLVGDTGATTQDRTPRAYLDDVRVYNEALTATQLNDIRLQNIPEPLGISVLALAGALVLRRRKPKKA